MKFQYATVTEAAIATHIVQVALQRGWLVSVSDGEEWVVQRSADIEKITDAMNSTGADELQFHEPSGVKLGAVTLIWGNDRDVISDHTMGNEAFSLFMDEMFNFADNQ